MVKGMVDALWHDGPCNHDHPDLWFRGIDIAKALGYADATKAIRQHVDDDYNKKPSSRVPDTVRERCLLSRLVVGRHHR